MEIKKYLDQVMDLPKMVNEKLPMNHWNSCMNDSEKGIPGWIHTILKIGALAFVLGGLWSVLKGFENIGDVFDVGAAEGIGFILGSLFWIYVLFPVSNVIRGFGEEIGSSSSNMVEFLFKDIPVAVIRAAGYIAALIGLFVALSMTFQWLTSISLGDSSYWGDIGAMINGFTEMSNLAIVVISGALEFDFMEMMEMFDGLGGGMMAYIDWFDFESLPIVIGAYLQVIVTLILLFVNIIIYKWLYTLATTFVNWISGPYLPFKTLK